MGRAVVHHRYRLNAPPGPGTSRAGERPLAWLDDDFGVLDHAWADERTAEGAPTLLIDVDPAVGLLQEHLDTVADWAEQLAERP